MYRNLYLYPKEFATSLANNIRTCKYVLMIFALYSCFKFSVYLHIKVKLYEYGIGLGAGIGSLEIDFDIF
jgi:hypothetical protein